MLQREWFVVFLFDYEALRCEEHAREADSVLDVGLHNLETVNDATLHHVTYLLTMDIKSDEDTPFLLNFIDQRCTAQPGFVLNHELEGHLKGIV